MPAFPSWAFTRWRHHNWGSRHPIAALLLIYWPRKDERLSWPIWLTHRGWLTYISGHPSAASRAQDSESTSAKDRCSNRNPNTNPSYGGRSLWRTDTLRSVYVIASFQCVTSIWHYVSEQLFNGDGFLLMIGFECAVTFHPFLTIVVAGEISHPVNRHSRSDRLSLDVAEADKISEWE